jgi:WD40 repeat protein
MAHDVFISYSSKDKPIADAVCANMEAAAIRCWIAPRDLAPGEDWPTAINKAISKSRVMVLIFSSNSNSSDDVGRELMLAASCKLVIIPFKIDNVEPEPGKQYYLARTHWLDAMNPPTREQIRKLVKTVKNLLLPDSPAAAPVTPELTPTTQNATRTPKAKSFKSWMLWIALPALVLLIGVICVGGVYMGMKLLAPGTNSPVPTWTASVPAQPLPLTPEPGITIPTTPAPAASVSVDVHATAGTILDVPGSNVAWSADGKWLVIGERQIHFYDPQSLHEVHSFQADRWVNGMTISPDSKVLAAIDETRGVMLFDMATGSELLTLPRTRISTSAASSSFLAFTPDSLTLAVVIGDTVKLFSVANGQETGTIVAKGAMAILFSPDGQSLYAGGWEGITVWDVSSGSQIRTMGDLNNEGSRLALSPDGSLLVSGGPFDQPMVLWETATGRQLRTFAGHTGGINSLVFSPDGKLLASAAGDVTIKLWDVATGTLLQTLVGHTEPASSLAFSPDGSTLVSIGYNQGVWFWGVPAKQE